MKIYLSHSIELGVINILNAFNRSVLKKINIGKLSDRQIEKTYKELEKELKQKLEIINTLDKDKIETESNKIYFIDKTYNKLFNDKS